MVHVAELFSGAGGFSASFRDSPFRVCDSFDLDDAACRVYKRNNPDTRVWNVDVTTVRDFSGLAKTPDVILAGPPCQGFSLVGMKTKRRLSIERGYNPATDPRNMLPLEVTRAAVQLKPEAVVMENVPAMNGHIVSHNGRDILVSELVAERLEEAGYRVSEPVLIDAHEIGAPQRRKRTFIIALKGSRLGTGDLAALVTKSTEGSHHSTLRSSIDDLTHYATIPPRSYTLPSFPDHVARVPNDDDLRIVSNLLPGEDYASLVERVPQVLEGRSHKTYSTTSFRDKFYRMRWDEPSRTIVAHLQKDGNSFIHPSLNRSISVREAARIQTFPDSFMFGVPMGHAYRLVGNAVPPLMGRFLVETVARIEGLIGERAAEGMRFASLVT